MELRACDCGAFRGMSVSATDIQEHLDQDAPRTVWIGRVHCPTCGRLGPRGEASTREGAMFAAIAGWNARPEEDRLRARVNELEDVLRSMLAQFDVYASPFSDQFVNKPLAPDGRDAYVLRTVQWKLRELIVRAHKLLNAALDGTP